MEIQSVKSFLTFLKGGKIQHFTDLTFTDGRDILAHAAASLTLEMLRRLPLDGDPTSLLRWNYSATLLGALLGRLGLVEPLMTGSYGQQFNQYCLQITQTGQRIPIFAAAKKSGLPEGYYRIIIPAIFCNDGILCGPDVRFEYYVEHHLCSDLGRHTSIHFSGDQSIALECIPVPRDLARHCGSADRDGDPSVMNLVSAFLGSPTLGLKDERIFAIALLASAAIANNTVMMPSLDLRYFREPNAVPDIRSRWSQNQADAGWNWLRVQLPTQVFSETVENLIRSAVGIRYRPEVDSQHDFK